MTKVVYNACPGGFSLNLNGRRRYLELKNGQCTDLEASCLDEYHLSRHDPILIQVVEELGVSCFGRYSDLKIFELQSDDYFIEEHDGVEIVHDRATYQPKWININV